METTPLDLRNRDGLFAALEAEVFDLAVIGGGITGAGVARDAAMRGMSVALVEAGDFGRGTSSRSSKMIHGGLRYLAQGDLALVREAASERKVLEAIAPRLTALTPFVLPARNAAAIARLRAGLWTFETLGGVQKARRHAVWSAAELGRREPSVDTAGLAGAVVYPEYLTDDARLTLANVKSAHAHGALTVSHAAARSITVAGGRAEAVEVVGTLPGEAERRVRLRARLVVNAAGPWVDQVRALESPDAAPRLSLTRGIHLVVPRARLPVERTIVMTAADRRSVFAVPAGEATYLGTTDTFVPGMSEEGGGEADIAWPAITGADADYLLEAAARRFRVAPLGRADVTAAWAGVRPLVGEAGKSPSDISRRDEVWTGPAGVISIAGGKLTAFRMMAERVVDLAEAALGRSHAACRTADEALPDACPAADLRALAGGPAAEAAHAVTREGALTLEDYWVRRSGRAWFDPDGGLAALAPAAEAMAPLLGWPEARVAAEIAACRARRAADMGAFGAASAA